METGLNIRYQLTTFDGGAGAWQLSAPSKKKKNNKKTQKADEMASFFEKLKIVYLL